MLDGIIKMKISFRVNLDGGQQATRWWWWSDPVMTHVIFVHVAKGFFSSHSAMSFLKDLILDLLGNVGRKVTSQTETHR